MLYNKNNVRKTNDKKILHKVGKQWKVVSVALLMAVAGGAVAATHANANADNVSGDTPQVANDPQFKAPVQSATPTRKPASSAGIHYYPGHSGAAASYFDKASSEEGVANKNYATVNAYVQSLNNEYNPQMGSYAAKINSASNAAKNDSKLAQSYNANINTSATKSTVNSLAAKNHIVDPDVYEGMVQGQEETFSTEVKSASGDAKAANDVSSLVNSLEGMDFSAASLNASGSAARANSALNAAQNTYNSVADRYGMGNDNAATFIDIANELSEGATTLGLENNDVIYNNDLNSLDNVNGANAAQISASLTSDINSSFASSNSVLSEAISDAISGNDVNAGRFDNNMGLSAYADAHFHNFNSFMNHNTTSSDAVSAGINEQLAGALASAASALYGKYNPVYGTANEFSAERSSAIKSASAALTAAKYADDFANANSAVVSQLSASATNNVPAFVRGLLNGNAVYNLENALGMAYAHTNRDLVPNGKTTQYIDNADNYVNYLTGQLTSQVKSFISKDDLSKVPSKLLGIYNTVYSEINPNNNKNIHVTRTEFGNAVYKLIYNKLSNNQNSQLKSNAKSYAKEAQTVADNVPVNKGKNSDTGVYGYKNEAPTKNTVIYHNDTNKYYGYHYHENNYYDNATAALLSAGVDVSALESEAGAINNVANTASNAANSLEKNNNASATLDGALSVAASSANSALGAAQEASANNSAANDDDVTLASYFANSYSNQANNESASASNEYINYNKFLESMTGNDATFVSADNAYAGNKAAADNDHKMGVENANAVYNESPHFLDVLKNAYLHTSADFGSNGDKKASVAKKGDRLTVLHTAFSRNNSWRGVTRFYVLDNTTGKKGFITGQPGYTKGAYLPSTPETAIVSVKALRPVNVYNNYQSKGKPVATLKAGQVVNDVRVVYANPDKDAMGFTKVETSDYNFFSANTDYVVFNTVTNNNSNNNTRSNENINLGNNGLGNDFNNNSFKY